MRERERERRDRDWFVWVFLPLAMIYLIGSAVDRSQRFRFRKIYPYEYVIDSFNNCTDGSFNAPLNYTIQSTRNLTVELLNQEGYNNLTFEQSYTPVKEYNLKPITLYYINLAMHYHRINGSCHIVTKNPTRYTAISRYKYKFHPLWKYLYF